MTWAALGWARKVKAELKQLRILTKHFFARLFRNEIVDFEDQMKGRLIALLSVLTIIVGWSSELLLFKFNMVPDVNISWQEKDYVFILMMIIFGIVTLLEWEVLFPDRQDFLNLTPLPIRLRTVFGAKLASFIGFIGLFSVAMNSMSSVLFAIYLGPWRSDSPMILFRYVLAHLASAFAACYFVFFACVFLQFVLMAVFPFTAYRRISLWVRFLLITVFIFFLLAFIAEPAILGGSLRSLARLKDSGAPFLFRFPPLWFVGLYEVLLGTNDIVFVALAKTAGLVLCLSLLAFLLAAALSYYRHVRKTGEGQKASPKLFWLRSSLAELFQGPVLRHPEERAVAGFFSKTIRSSPKHRVTVTNYAAVAAGFMMLLVAANRRNLGALTLQNKSLLALQLILLSFLLIGIRAAVNIPAAPEARWIFKATEGAFRTRYVSGLKKAVFFSWFAPLSVLVFLAHLLIWRNGQWAFGHAIFGLTVAGLGVEAAFCRFRKIPFACTYVPGQSRLQSRVVLYLLGFIAFLAF